MGIENIQISPSENPAPAGNKADQTPTVRKFIRMTQHLAGDKRFFTPTIALFIASATLLAGNFLWSFMTPGDLWALHFGISLFGYYLLYTTLHEAIHSTHKSKRVNQGIIWGCSVLFAMPLDIYKGLHLEHHSYSNMPEKDPDLWNLGSYPLLRWLTLFGHYFHWVGTRGRSREKKMAIAYGLIMVLFITAVSGGEY